MSYTVNCSILLTELPLLERPAAAAAAGFDAVEFWWPFASATPDTRDIREFESAIRDAGVALTGLNFAAGDMPAGERGLLSSPSRSQEFRDNIAVVMEIGQHLGCRNFNALYGLREDGVDPAEQDALAAENLSLAAEAAARIGGTVLLEPVSGSPAYPLLTASDVLAVIDRVGALKRHGRVALLADFYHLAVNGDDVAAVIRDHGARFGHVQIADSPGRGEPGSGQLPLGEWIAATRTAGYTGEIGLEYKTAAADPFAWLPREQRSTR